MKDADGLETRFINRPCCDCGSMFYGLASKRRCPVCRWKRITIKKKCSKMAYKASGWKVVDMMAKEV